MERDGVYRMTQFVTRNREQANIPAPINGLNTVDDELTMNPTMSPDLQNIEINLDKGPVSRKGYSFYRLLRSSSNMQPFTGRITYRLLSTEDG